MPLIVLLHCIIILLLMMNYFYQKNLRELMSFLQKKFLFLFILCIYTTDSVALTEYARSKGFVYLHEVDSTIQVSLRYHSCENFLGTPVEGYKKAVVIVTEQTAQALKAVQQEVNAAGYNLVVYDAYRPQQAVNHFIKWSTDINDQTKKSQYYPRINKADVFELGYVAHRSGHSRGSTVDLTLIKIDQKLHDVKEIERTLLDGSVIRYLDDGTINMGSSFDIFDVASHYDNSLITQECKQMRAYLKNVMEKHGFKNYAEEWWHFTLKNERFPANQDDSYFDFEVE